MAQVTVTTVATQLATGSAGSVLICNRGSVAVFVDFVPTVTTATGFELDAGQSISVAQPTQLSNQGGTLYAVTASSTARVDVLSVRL